MTTNAQVPEAKAQHYIPKFYLKGFTDKQGILWVCERFKSIRASRPKDEANRPDYYTHNETGERDETAENTLEQIESRAAPVVLKLANPLFEPTPEQAGHLFIFVAFMFARVPMWREHLDKAAAELLKRDQQHIASNKETFYKMCAAFECETGKSFGMEYEEMRQLLLKGDFEIVQESIAFNLGSMFYSAFNIVGELKHYGYEVLYAPKNKFFLTSDSPVFTLQPDGRGQATVGMGFGWPGIEVYFPLNKRSCLRLEKGIAPMASEINEKGLEQINRMVMATAGQCVYSSEGHRKISRLFDQYGCEIQPGKNAFMLTPESPKQSPPRH